MSIAFHKRMVDSTAWYDNDRPALNAEHLANLTVSTPQLELPMVILIAYSAVERLEPVGAKDCHMSQYYTSGIQELTKRFKAAHINLFSERRL